MVCRSTAVRPRPSGAPAGARCRLPTRAFLAIATLVACVMGCLSMALAAPPNPLSVAGDGGGAPLPDLTLSMAGPSSVPTSTPMTYTLTVHNIGAANVTGVTVVDTLPSGLTAISASGTSLFTCEVSDETVTCTGGAVNPGSTGLVIGASEGTTDALGVACAAGGFDATRTMSARRFCARPSGVTFEATGRNSA